MEVERGDTSVAGWTRPKLMRKYKEMLGISRSISKALVREVGVVSGLYVDYFTKAIVLLLDDVVNFMEQGLSERNANMQI